MKRTIWKNSIPINDDGILIEFPIGAEFLHIGRTNQTPSNHLDVWYEFDAEQTSKLIDRFFVVGTGHYIYNDAARYVGTYTDPEQFFVWHVYRGPTERKSLDGDR